MLERLWRNGDPNSLLVGMQTGAASMEKVWTFLKKLKIEIPYDQLSHYWVSTQRT